MKNQTIKKGPDNRGQNEQKELEIKLRLIWLDKGELFQTSDQEVACDIEQIQELLEEDENDPNTKEYPTC